MENNYILEMRSIEKSFGDVRVLEDVSLCVRRGSVLALLGENGAGKSTLMKILLGVYTADSGSIVYDGQKIGNHSIHHSLDLGISMICQELSPIPAMTVAENIWLGREPRAGRTGLVDDKKMLADTAALFARFGIQQIDPKTKMSRLSVAQMQLVEICKAISYHSKLIIMDEPTSSLAKKEIEQLFETIWGLRSEGVSFIFISHKLDEIFDISDEVTILRDGEVVCSKPTAELTERQIIESMVGREITHIYPKLDVPIGEVYFSVNHLSVDGVFEDVSFEVRKGEIFGFSGLIGAGRTEVMETLFGYRSKSSGTVSIQGKEVVIRKPKDAIRNKMAFVTEDRKATGLFLPLDTLNNMLMPMLHAHLRGLLLNETSMRLCCEEQIRAFGIKTSSCKQIVNDLSGGNQQKILLARWLLTVPDIIILDEPTRGIDVGAKADIYEMIGQLAQAGKCVIVISSELPEVMGISDRIAVMHEGKLVRILDRAEFDRNVIMSYATGFQM